MALIKERLGVFRGFGDSRYEVLSEILLPYQSSRMPLQGGYLVVGVEDFDGRPRGVLGRVVRAYPLGDLLGGAGEDYLVDLMRLGKEIPEEVRISRLRYRVSLRLLGQISEPSSGVLEFSPSIRITPHVGAPVGFASDEVLELVARGTARMDEEVGACIGHLAVGDLVFDGSPRVRGRSLPVHFRMQSLVGRRTAVFARAGMGKSNFVKVLLTRLYQDKAQRVGTLVIDPEGEYAMANASEPGLLDVPELGDRVILYTDRTDCDSRYAENIRGGCRINFTQLSPYDVVANAVPAEKQEMVFANCVRGLDPGAWTRLVQTLAKERFRANTTNLANIIGRKTRPGESEDVILSAIVNNLVPPISRLHDESSNLLAEALDQLSRGGIVVLDVSMLGASDAQRIAAWLMNKIFFNNQSHYTTQRHDDAPRRSGGVIPTLAVMEEAQYYLGDRNMREDSPFVRWFKEGRKYQLGSILVTQQPGAVGGELISQCDNFFAFHLLSHMDLEALGHANLHYSNDILTSLASEPIPGNCFLWSSRGMSIVTCSRILEFKSVVTESQAAPAKHPPSSEATSPGSTQAEVSASAIPKARQDPYQQLCLLVDSILQSHRPVALYVVTSRKLKWEDARDDQYPPSEELLAVNAYNLRFQVTDMLDSQKYSGGLSTQEKAMLLEPFKDRTLVREDLLQKALRDRGYCPERFIGRGTEKRGGAAPEFYLILRAKIADPNRIKQQTAKDVEVLP